MRLAPHPGRKRRLAGWLLLSLAALSAALWLISGWWSFDYTGQSSTLGIGGGEIAWSRFMPSTSYQPALWHFRPVTPHAHRFHWTVEDTWPANATHTTHWNLGLAAYAGGVGIVHEVVIYPWPVPLLLTAAAVPLLRSGVIARRRARAGYCLNCGYDKRGLPADAACPECGKTHATT